MLTNFSYHGVATHYVPSASLELLSSRLSELNFKDYASNEERFKIIASTIAEFDAGLPAPRPAISGPIRKIIDQCFKYDSAIDILSELESVKSQTSDEAIQKWITKTVATIRERSPIGVAVTLKEMRLGKNWNIAQAFQNEHAIASEFMRHPDFVEGVTARLITRSKERPNWKPNQLEDVTDSDVNAFYAEVDNPSTALKLMTTGASAKFDEYPYAWLGLPTEAEIKERLAQKPAEQVIQDIIREKDGKIGVREKVEEVLERL